MHNKNQTISYKQLKKLESRPEDALGLLVETVETVKTVDSVEIVETEDHSLTLFSDNLKARDASASKNHTIKPYYSTTDTIPYYSTIEPYYSMIPWCDTRCTVVHPLTKSGPGLERSFPSVGALCRTYAQQMQIQMKMKRHTTGMLGSEKTF